jgi:hypothetical protein
LAFYDLINLFLIVTQSSLAQTLKYFVGVDIGGTNTRVALDTGTADEPYIQVHH